MRNIPPNAPTSGPNIPTGRTEARNAGGAKAVKPAIAAAGRAAIPATPAPTAPLGSYWVVRNSTSNYLSAAITNPSNLSSPLSLAPSTNTAIVLTGQGGNTGYILF